MLKKPRACRHVNCWYDSLPQEGERGVIVWIKIWNIYQKTTTKKPNISVMFSQNNFHQMPFSLHVFCFVFSSLTFVNVSTFRCDICGSGARLDIRVHAAASSCCCLETDVETAKTVSLGRRSRKGQRFFSRGLEQPWSWTSYWREPSRGCEGVPQGRCAQVASRWCSSSYPFHLRLDKGTTSSSCFTFRSLTSKSWFCESRIFNKNVQKVDFFFYTKWRFDVKTFAKFEILQKKILF